MTDHHSTEEWAREAARYQCVADERHATARRRPSTRMVVVSVVGWLIILALAAWAVLVLTGTLP